MITRKDVLERIESLQKINSIKPLRMFDYLEKDIPLITNIFEQKNILPFINELDNYTSDVKYPQIHEMMKNFLDQFRNKPEEEIRKDPELSKIVFGDDESSKSKTNRKVSKSDKENTADENSNKNDKDTISDSSEVKISKSKIKTKKKISKDLFSFDIFNTF